MKLPIPILFFLLLIGFTNFGQPILLPTILKNSVNKKNQSTNVTKYLTEKKWNELFPNRYGNGVKNSLPKPDFYSFKNFVIAAKLFPTFLAAGNKSIQKKELAAFLANIAQETSAGWDAAPGGYFKWGLYFIEEIDSTHLYAYNDTANKKYHGVDKEYYYGRGPKQLSWNYNYGQFSEAWYGTKDTLLLHPSLLSSDPILSFASAIWFWMTPQFPKPSCHNIIICQWIPNSNDTLKQRFPGFGATLNVINGGLECGAQSDLLKTTYRYKYYQYFCNYFNVAMGENIYCTCQTPFGR